METERNNQNRDVLKNMISSNIKSGLSILSNSENTYMVVDHEGNIKDISSKGKSLLGLSKHSQFEGMKLHQFISPEMEHKKTYYQKLNSLDAYLTLRNGSKKRVHIVCIPVFLKATYACSYIVVTDSANSEVSEELEEKSYKKMFDALSVLAEKQATAGQLAAGIAHEIRNPITAIKGFLQLINKENIGNRIYFDIIDAEIERIEVILKQLMVLAKPTKSQYQRINYNELLDQVVIFMESQALLNNVEIKKSYHFQNLLLYGDENQLKQVFINYIKNAIEAMTNGGILQIEGQISEEGIVQVTIIDNGSGIPEDVLDRIGEPFFTTKENGTGLGLLVSKQIIEEHKGTVSITSNEKGTSVTVKLPLVMFSMEP